MSLQCRWKNLSITSPVFVTLMTSVLRSICLLQVLDKLIKKKCAMWLSRPIEGASILSLRQKVLFIIVVLITQSCPTLWGPTDYSPPGSCVHGILQTRILEWVTIPFSKGSSQPRDQIQVSCIAGRFFTTWATGKSHWTLILKICLGTSSSSSQPAVCLYCLSC